LKLDEVFIVERALESHQAGPVAFCWSWPEVCAEGRDGVRVAFRGGRP
jgi:hypothetical protein